MANILHEIFKRIFKWIFWHEHLSIANEISLKCIPFGLIDNLAALVQIMARRWTGDKPLYDSMVDSFTDAYMHHSASIS